MDVSSKQLDKYIDGDFSKELEKSCKVSKETKLSLEQKSNNDSDSSSSEESNSDSDSSSSEESNSDSDSSSSEETELPSNSLVKLISDQKRKEEKKNIWEKSPYRDLPNLQSNNTGIVGENFINLLCINSKIPVCIDGTKTKKKGGGNGDGKIKDKWVEIKTSHQGVGRGKTFQHELGETPWKSNYMIFLDIAPQYCYLTILPRFTEELCKKDIKFSPYFPTKSICWRKQKGNFKFDTSVNLNEQSIIKGNTIKITDKTTYKQIGKFIDNLIK